MTRRWSLAILCIFAYGGCGCLTTREAHSKTLSVTQRAVHSSVRKVNNHPAISICKLPSVAIFDCMSVKGYKFSLCVDPGSARNIELTSTEMAQFHDGGFSTPTQGSWASQSGVSTIIEFRRAANSMTRLLVESSYSEGDTAEIQFINGASKTGTFCKPSTIHVYDAQPAVTITGKRRIPSIWSLALEHYTTKVDLDFDLFRDFRP